MDVYGYLVTDLWSFDSSIETARIFHIAQTEGGQFVVEGRFVFTLGCFHPWVAHAILVGRGGISASEPASVPCFLGVPGMLAENHLDLAMTV